MSFKTVIAVLEIFNVPIWLYLATTSPTPSTPNERRLRNDWAIYTTPSLRLLQFFSFVNATIESFWMLVSCGLLPSFLAAYMHLPEGHAIYLSPMRAVSGLFIITGGFLRWKCMRELGPYFTFQVTMLDKHNLITSGPYSYVRHPSYSGAILINLGLWPWLFLPGSWSTESGLSGSVGFWLAISPCVAVAALSVPMIFGRCRREDELLEERFGERWRSWAEIVPYRLIPGIY